MMQVKRKKHKHIYEILLLYNYYYIIITLIEKMCCTSKNINSLNKIMYNLFFFKNFCKIIAYIILRVFLYWALQF